jgi:hypothetical protein
VAPCKQSSSKQQQNAQIKQRRNKLRGAETECKRSYQFSSAQGLHLGLSSTIPFLPALEAIGRLLNRLEFKALVGRLAFIRIVGLSSTPSVALLSAEPGISRKLLPLLEEPSEEGARVAADEGGRCPYPELRTGVVGFGASDGRLPMAVDAAMVACWYGVVEVGLMLRG